MVYDLADQMIGKASQNWLLTESACDHHMTFLLNLRKDAHVCRQICPLVLSFSLLLRPYTDRSMPDLSRLIKDNPILAS